MNGKMSVDFYPACPYCGEINEQCGYFKNVDMIRCGMLCHSESGLYFCRECRREYLVDASVQLNLEAYTISKYTEADKAS